MRINVDIEEVLAYRDKFGVGILEAKRILWKREARRRVEQASNVQDLKDVLLDLIGGDE